MMVVKVTIVVVKPGRAFVEAAKVSACVFTIVILLVMSGSAARTWDPPAWPPAGPARSVRPGRSDSRLILVQVSGRGDNSVGGSHGLAAGLIPFI